MLKNYDIRFPLLFAAACLFEVVGAAFGVWNSFMVVGYRMSGLMPAFLSLMEVARPFVIGPLLTDRFRLLHRGCALLALCLLSVVGYKNWSIQANIWFNDMVEKAATAQETVASAEDSLRTAEKGLAEQVEQVTRQAALDATKRVALEASIAGSEQAAKDLRGRLGELDRAYKEQREFEHGRLHEGLDPRVRRQSAETSWRKVRGRHQVPPRPAPAARGVEGGRRRTAAQD